MQSVSAALKKPSVELKEKVLVWFLMNPYNTWMAEIEVASFFCQLDRYKDSVNCLARISDFGLNIGETFIVCTKRIANFKTVFFWSISIYNQKSLIKIFFEWNSIFLAHCGGGVLSEKDL